jgi:carboxyl-terminal processing protease
MASVAMLSFLPVSVIPRNRRCFREFTHMRFLNAVPALVVLVVLAGCHRRNVPTPATAEPSSCALPAAAQPVSLAATPAVDPVITFDSAWTIIKRTHWDTTYNGVNWDALRIELRPKAEAATTLGQLRSVLSDMISRLRQSHFSIIPREASDVTPGASLGGASQPERSGTTGVTLRLIDKELVVTRVASGSPAALAGIRPGYVLDAVEGCPLAPRIARIPADLGERRVALSGYSIGTQALAGPVNSTVNATFRDGSGVERPVALVRTAEPGTTVKFGNLPARVANLEWERRNVNGKTVGVIRWNIWMPILGPQFDAAIDSLRDSDAILLDIRGNPGGVGGMAMGFSGHFVDSTRVIGLMKQRGTNDMRFTANPRFVNGAGQRVQPYTGPVALVVDEISVSTSEIFAEGMQNIGRARVFGTQTAGQALPSVAERLPNGDILYHAIANFVSPTGKQIEGEGVTPNVKVPPTKKALLEGKDPALDAALLWAATQARRM